MELSELISEHVTHTVYGNGEIIRIERNGIRKYISVNFDTISEAKTFQFPQIFSEFHLLSTNSSIIRQLISEEPACEICGKIGIELKIVNERKVCYYCAKTTVKCVDCGKDLFPDEVAFELPFDVFYNGRKCVCKECGKKYRKCEDCGKIYDLEARMIDYPKIPKGINLCDICIEHNFPVCHIYSHYYLVKMLSM